MPSPIYQNMVNLIVRLPIRRCPSKFMKVRCGNIVLLTVRYFDVAKFTTLTALSLLISCKLSFPIVGLKMSSLPICDSNSSDINLIIKARTHYYMSRNPGHVTIYISVTNATNFYSHLILHSRPFGNKWPSSVACLCTILHVRITCG
jgi:hypothetical protein